VAAKEIAKMECGKEKFSVTQRSTLFNQNNHAATRYTPSGGFSPEECVVCVFSSTKSAINLKSRPHQ